MTEEEIVRKELKKTLRTSQKLFHLLFKKNKPGTTKQNWAYFLFFSPQPPPTYEESIRQSVELTYDIFPSCLDISPPQCIYARSNVTNPVRSDGTVLSVWRRLSASAARRRGEFGSFKHGVDDWFIAGCFTLTGRSYSSDGPTKEELHTTQGLNSCSWPRLNVVKSGRLTRRTLDVERNNEVAGTPAATTGLKRFLQREPSFAHDFILEHLFSSAVPSPEATLSSF